MTPDSRPEHSSRDVRSRGFASRTSVSDALQWLDRQLVTLDTEFISLHAAAGRVLARDVVSRYDVPGFDRAMMDGLALRAADVAGATADRPVRLEVIGRAFPGRPFAGRVGAGEAVRIMTGAPAPDGVDAVLPIEFVRLDESAGESASGSGGADSSESLKLDVTAETAEALAPIASGKHVGRAGEDVARGSAVLSAGRVLRPQDLGVLSSIGMAEAPVVRRPRVRIVITGSELLPAGSAPRDYRIVDANGPLLRALVVRDGGEPVGHGIVPDDPEAIASAMLDDADVVIVSGGTSVGQEDHAPQVVRRLGELAVHGVGMRPSAPTGLGLVDGRLVVLAPGSPVACLCAYDFFAGRAVRRLGGRSADWPYRSESMRTVREIPSAAGRVEYVRVRRTDEGVEPLPPGGAAQLSTTVRADGFVIVPEESERVAAGSEVRVYWYD